MEAATLPRNWIIFPRNWIILPKLYIAATIYYLQQPKSALLSCSITACFSLDICKWDCCVIKRRGRGKKSKICQKENNEQIQKMNHVEAAWVIFFCIGFRKVSSCHAENNSTAMCKVHLAIKRSFSWTWQEADASLR